MNKINKKLTLNVVSKRGANVGLKYKSMNVEDALSFKKLRDRMQSTINQFFYEYHLDFCMSRTNELDKKTMLKFLAKDLK